MKVETIDRLITEDMISQGKCLDEIMQTVPPERRREFSDNIRPLIIERLRTFGKSRSMMKFLFGRYKTNNDTNE